MCDPDPALQPATVLQVIDVIPHRCAATHRPLCAQMVLRETRWHGHATIDIIVDYLFLLDVALRLRTTYRDHGCENLAPAHVPSAKLHASRQLRRVGTRDISFTNSCAVSQSTYRTHARLHTTT